MIEIPNREPAQPPPVAETPDDTLRWIQFWILFLGSVWVAAVIVFALTGVLQ